MKGRKIPWTHSRAIAYMACNELNKYEKPKLKRQARREERRYLKIRMA